MNIESCELTQSFGGARLLYTHRLPDNLLISRAVNNVARDLSRDEHFKPAIDFVKRVKCNEENSAKKLTALQILSSALRNIIKMNQRERKQYADKHKEILHTIFFMTRGNCLLACRDCYTDQMFGPQAPWDVYAASFDEARKYGAKVIYMAGEGCPLLDEHIGKIFEYAQKHGMIVHMFQSGMQFCHETVPIRRLRARIMGVDGEISAPVFVKWWASKPVYLYLKWHSVRANYNSWLCGLPRGNFDYTYELQTYHGKKVYIPSPILRFPEWGWPLERLGFDTMVIKQNANEVCDVIAPWAKENGYAHFCEPHIDSGRRTLINPAPTPAQLQKLNQAGFLVRQNCTLNKVLGKIVVWPNRGFVSPISAFTWRDLQGRSSMVYNPDRGFIEQRDNHPLFQKLRYAGGCPCAVGTSNLRAWLDEFAPKKEQ